MKKTNLLKIFAVVLFFTNGFFAQERNVLQHPDNLKNMTLEEVFTRGAQYYNEGKYDEAFVFFYEAAIRGYGDAQRLVGDMLEDGNGTEQNSLRANSWYEKAKENGSLEAINNLAMAYDAGRGFEVDKEKAFELYKLAAEKGHATSQDNLGRMFEYGIGVKECYTWALGWYLKAAKQNYPGAAEKWLKMYFTFRTLVNVEQCNIDSVLFYINNGAGINLDDRDGFPALHWNANHVGDCSEMTKFLLENGAKIDAVDHENRTAIYIAAYCGNANIVRELLKNNANPYIESHETLPIDVATQQKQNDVVAVLDSNQKGAEKLLYAIHDGKEDIVDSLLASGINPNIHLPTKNGIPPLFYSLHLGKYELAQKLIDNGADIDMIFEDMTALYKYAALSADTVAAKVLLKNGANINKEVKGIGDMPILIVNLFASNYIPSQSEDAKTEDWLPIAELLIEYGVDITQGDPTTRESPLIAAIKYGYNDIIKMLINKGADINARSFFNGTPLMYAADKGDLTTIKLLCENGADITLIDYYERDAFIVAIQKGHLDVVKYLLEKDIEAKQINGWKALDYAIRNNQIAVRDYLAKMNFHQATLGTPINIDRLTVTVKQKLLNVDESIEFLSLGVNNTIVNVQNDNNKIYYYKINDVGTPIEIIKENLSLGLCFELNVDEEVKINRIQVLNEKLEEINFPHFQSAVINNKVLFLKMKDNFYEAKYLNVELENYLGDIIVLPLFPLEI